MRVHHAQNYGPALPSRTTSFPHEMAIPSAGALCLYASTSQLLASCAKTP